MSEAGAVVNLDCCGARGGKRVEGMGEGRTLSLPKAAELLTDVLKTTFSGLMSRCTMLFSWR